MTIVSNDPTLWPIISYFRLLSYFSVASLTVVVYDWVLTSAQEIEFVWRQRWSLMTVLYLTVRYIGIPFAAILMIPNLLSTSLTDAGCLVLYIAANWMSVVANFMLGAIMIIRLHAMYQRSRKMLVFLCAIFLALRITAVIIIGMRNKSLSGTEYVLSGAHLCNYDDSDTNLFLLQTTWILGTAWEILAFCLAAWIAVKHFRELSTGWVVEDCFTILIETHVCYFASFLAVSCFQLTYLSPKINNSPSSAANDFSGFLFTAQIVQVFVMGPRLILGVRESNAKLVANSDEATAMTSIAFQDRIHIPTGDGV